MLPAIIIRQAILEDVSDMRLLFEAKEDFMGWSDYLLWMSKLLPPSLTMLSLPSDFFKVNEENI